MNITGATDKSMAVYTKASIYKSDSLGVIPYWTSPMQ
jgi:hypothetical protein